MKLFTMAMAVTLLSTAGVTAYAQESISTPSTPPATDTAHPGAVNPDSTALLGQPTTPTAAQRAAMTPEAQAAAQTPGQTATPAPETPAQQKAQREQQKSAEKAAKEQAKAAKEQSKALKHSDKSTNAAEKAASQQPQPPPPPATPPQ